MAKPHSFNLDQAIKHWENKLLESENLTIADVYELKNHLLEQIDELKQANLSEEEAFYVAQKRLGSIDALNQEFGKINHQTANHKYLIMMLLGVIMFWNFSFLMEIIGNLFTVLVFRPNQLSLKEIDVDLRWFDFTFRWILLVSILSLGWYFLRRKNDFIPRFYTSILQKPYKLLIPLLLVTPVLAILNQVIYRWIIRLDRDFYFGFSYHLIHFKAYFGIILLLVFWLLVIEYQKGFIFSMIDIFKKANFWFLFIISFGIKSFPTLGTPALAFSGLMGWHIVDFLVYAFFAYYFNYNQHYSKKTLLGILLFHSIWVTGFVLYYNPENNHIIQIMMMDVVGALVGLGLSEFQRQRARTIIS
jgi:hypothetical protein